MRKKHKKVLDLIKAIRLSFHDSVIVYRYGGCYGLYQIIKEVFPESKAYFENDKKEHIVIEINGRFYEIKGESDCDTTKFVLLTEKDHEQWESNASGQRLEYMLVKYNSHHKE